MKAWIAVGLLIVLFGCSSSPNRLNRRLRPYVGRNIAAVAAVLGDPDSERKTLDETQYFWTLDHRFTVARPGPGANLIGLTRAPFYPGPSDFTTHDTEMHYVCQLQVVTSGDGIIKTFQSSGNEGCERFLTALEM